MPLKRLTRAEITAQIPAARAREAAERRAGLRARSAAFDPATGRLILELTNGTVFGFPPQLVPDLRGLTREELERVTLSPSGDELFWDAQDLQVSVPGVLMASFNRTQKFRELARLAGSVRSKAKARAARLNGTKGGRPRKAAKAR